MADVTIKYNGSAIAELNGTGSKTLKTSGKYCEGNVEVAYAPRTKTYEITLAKASGWVLLTTLDDDVIAHINDKNFTVTLAKISSETQEKFCAPGGFVTNINLGNQSVYAVYGACLFITGDTAVNCSQVYYPANNTDANTSLGGRLAFRLSGNQYYVCSPSYYIHAGTYKLTFTW